MITAVSHTHKVVYFSIELSKKCRDRALHVPGGAI